jgi:hypothetical protein
MAIFQPGHDVSGGDEGLPDHNGPHWHEIRFMPHRPLGTNGVETGQ